MWDRLRPWVDRRRGLVRVPVRFLFHFFWGFGGVLTWLAIITAISQLPALHDWLNGTDWRRLQFAGNESSWVGKNLSALNSLSAFVPTALFLVGACIAWWRTAWEEGWLAYVRAGTAEGSDRLADPRFSMHLHDVQEFARKAMECIHPENREMRGEGWMPIPCTPSEVQALQVHFPDAGEFVYEWNETTAAYQAAVPELMHELEQIARDERCDFTGNGLTGLLEYIAKDWGHIENIEFRTSEERLMAYVAVGAAPYTIRAVASREEADALRGRVLMRLKELRAMNTVQARTRLLRAIIELRPRAHDSLSKASRTHDLVGTCETCPSMSGTQTS